MFYSKLVCSCYFYSVQFYHDLRGIQEIWILSVLGRYGLFTARTQDIAEAARGGPRFAGIRGLPLFHQSAYMTRLDPVIDTDTKRPLP